MTKKYKVIFLPLHREMGDHIGSEVYWAFNTIRIFKEKIPVIGYVGHSSPESEKLFVEEGLPIKSLGISRDRTFFEDIKFYFRIFLTGIKIHNQTSYLHHYGSFGFKVGWNPVFFLPKFGVKYIIGPIFYPSMDEIDTLNKLFGIRVHNYSKIVKKFFLFLNLITMLRADILIFEYEKTRELYLKVFKFLKNKQYYIIVGGGISEKDFSYIPRNVNSQKILLGVASNLIKRKNIDKIVSLFPKIPENVELLIANDGPELEKIMELSKKLNVEKRIIFLGRIPRWKLNEFYNKIDIYISLDPFAGSFPPSVQEASMCGCAILSAESDIGNDIKILPWGVLVNPYSNESILKGLNYLIENTERLNIIRQNAYINAKKTFSDKAIEEKLLNIYK